METVNDRIGSLCGSIVDALDHDSTQYKSVLLYQLFPKLL